ncbi:MAG: mechanosensitive ion channel family protein [Paracoccus sp. (in: a-proteobacteria)]|jgi:small-conductance mechanosensitive channel|uniref:mechanosensitive ion channel family protein n=1 Tax=unclassified Paracoccus (in: a-proteobacteria) TaxID=2688777 RepID=UPI000C60BE92|nr:MULTISPECIES: mechanosensitive ion channel family protein [unclassified Paracoccus (in: a-proteobacteria)]MAN55563.1 mechanosensitive ion channel protein MscS [Paracoccus sp. (in: a-proteobacteria)]MBA48282.1 mechanosensitive ion channel protein MscS [Paracoccus sp. (in: a-proteobacteria)]|tara:strand:+ start:3928 stop:5241 length:1314 start_codon:yes stop_codon:yes gene_type:complete
MIRALLLSILLVLPFAAVSQAREDGGVITAPSGTIPVGDNAASDAAIRTRIDSILSQVSAFDKVRARVDAGIVRLTGEVTEQVQIDRLNALMARVDGVVAIQNDVILTTDIGLRLGTVRDRFLQRLNQVIAGLPFVALGLVVGALILLVGSWISRRERTLARVAPNPFIAGFLAQVIRLIAWIVALVVALDLMGATALLGTLLGAAGIFGLSLSFAARDTIEGLVATILLSLRQPFGPNDLIEVNDQRGRVIRMTSRGTTLLTLDGNHIRIPNQIIYKAVLTNYTRNPERRFLVDLVIDPVSDLGRARDLALRVLAGMSFVLQRPEPVAWVEATSPETLVIRAGGWVSQDGTDFDLARGEAFRLLRRAMDAEGFGLPEPIHRIHVEGADPSPAAQPVPRPAATRREKPPDLSPDATFEELLDRERGDGRNLLTPVGE